MHSCHCGIIAVRNISVAQFMPYLNIITNLSLNDAVRVTLAKAISTWTAEQLRKSESYVMTHIADAQAMTFAGTDAPCAYVELKSLGLSESQTASLSNGLCTLLEQELKVEPARVYIEFSSSPRPMWGWNGKTF